MVQVIPSNLLRFNFYVIVFAAGYYNMALYDIYDDEGNKRTDDENA
jgi:hypothetical protein